MPLSRQSRKFALDGVTSTPGSAASSAARRSPLPHDGVDAALKVRQVVQARQRRDFGRHVDVIRLLDRAARGR